MAGAPALESLKAVSAVSQPCSRFMHIIYTVLGIYVHLHSHHIHGGHILRQTVRFDGFDCRDRPLYIIYVYLVLSRRPITEQTKILVHALQIDVAVNPRWYFAIV